MGHDFNCINYVCTCGPKFQKGSVLRHKNCLDLDIVIADVITKSLTYVDLDVWWWNRNYDVVVNSRTETIRINIEDYPNWTLIGKKDL